MAHFVYFVKSSSAFSQRRIWLWLCLGLLAWVVRFNTLLRFSASPYFWPNGDDMKFYHDWALRILEGHWTDGHAFYGLPGYPFCLATIYAVVGVNPFAVGILQCTFEALTSVFIGLLGYQFAKNSNASTPGIGIGLLAGLGWIAFQPAQALSIILMPTAWVVAAFWRLVLWVATIDERTTWRSWLVMGLLVGAVSLLVATILMLLALVLAAIWLHVGPSVPWQKRMVPALGAAALVFFGLFAGMAPKFK